MQRCTNWKRHFAFCTYFHRHSQCDLQQPSEAKRWHQVGLQFTKQFRDHSAALTLYFPPAAISKARRPPGTTRSRTDPEEGNVRPESLTSSTEHSPRFSAPSWQHASDMLCGQVAAVKVTTTKQGKDRQQMAGSMANCHAFGFDSARQ